MFSSLIDRVFINYLIWHHPNCDLVDQEMKDYGRNVFFPDWQGLHKLFDLAPPQLWPRWPRDERLWQKCFLPFSESFMSIDNKLWLLPHLRIFGNDTIIAWWLHQMKTFSMLLALSAGNSPVRGIHRWIPLTKARRGAFMFSFVCARTNGWVNNRDAGDFRCHCASYDITIMWPQWLNLYLLMAQKWQKLAEMSSLEPLSVKHFLSSNLIPVRNMHLLKSC